MPWVHKSFVVGEEPDAARVEVLDTGAVAVYHWEDVVIPASTARKIARAIMETEGLTPRPPPGKGTDQ
jgi:hypothetical protein